MNAGCGCSGPGDIAYVPVAGRKTGVTGLLDVFHRWREGNRTPEDISEAEILHALKQHNYIAVSVEKEYAEAVRGKYREFVEGEK